jgi:hypothetical protein
LATVHTQFVAVQNNHWNPTYTWSRLIQSNFVNLSDVELARLTKQYVVEGGNLQTLVDYMVCCITPLEQRRLAAATSDQMVENALAPYGSAAVAAFVAQPAYATVPIGRSYRQYIHSGLNPTVKIPVSSGVAPTLPAGALDMTFYELYLDYRTGAGALTVTSALYAAGYWWTLAGTGAALFGYGVGTGALALADVISPGFSEWLAGELGAGIQDAVDVLSAPYTPLPDPGCGCSVTIEWEDLKD